MFCFQCQEAAQNVGCTDIGVCGKTPDVAALQDLLTFLLKGISAYGVKDEAHKRFIAEALFATVTNVNFDPDRFVTLIKQAVEIRDVAQKESSRKPTIEAATWQPKDFENGTLVGKGMLVGVKADPDLNEDIRSLRELLIYGIRGLAAYTDHAFVLDHNDGELLDFLQEGLKATTDDLSADELVAKILRCGEMGVKAMALLDTANTSTYGNPEPTAVKTGVKDGPAILISGHDLRDMEELLEQTAGTGVNIYTHGEMLPAHAYPQFKKYDHLVGNYGGAWFDQNKDFESFNGAIVMTTNCIVKPRDSYKDRIFTTGLVGWPGVKHIADRSKTKQKDFSAVVEMAKTLPGPKSIEDGEVTIGFAHQSTLSVADKVVEAVKAGAIKRFVVMAGCDARHKNRRYYTELAEALPKDHVILTAGCAKYRYNKLDLGDIGGIPRMLDAGQCNDSYSLVVVAQKLAEVFGVEDINDLPISYDIAWYEQKAVIVLLALLHLGVKHIRLGPSLPAFISEGVLKVLVDTFDIKPNASVEEDLAAIVAGN